MRSLKATHSEVMAIPAPNWTDSWHPVAHGDVLRAVASAIRQNDMAIVDEHYSLSQGGKNMFGVLTIENGGHLPSVAGTTLQLGVRNSISKAMAVGVTAGTKVTVCSNMMFSGEFIAFRKHTSGLDLDELYEIAITSIAQAAEKMGVLVQWQEGLKEIELPETHMKLLTYDGMASGAIAPSSFNSFLDLHKEEVKLNGNSVYSWHGAGTRACRDNSLFSIAQKTPKLNTIASGYVDAIMSLR